MSGPRGASHAHVVERVAEVPVAPDLRSFEILSGLARDGRKAARFCASFGVEEGMCRHDVTLIPT